MSSRGVRVDWHLETVDSAWNPLDCEEHAQSVYVRRKVVLEAWMLLWRVQYSFSLVRGSCVTAWLTTTATAIRHSNSGSYFYFFFQTKTQVSPWCWIVYSSSTCLFLTVWIIIVPVTTAWRVLRLRIEERPPIRRVTANKLNKQSRTADEGWSSSSGVGRGANNPFA